MLETLIITFREGLEAFLIIAITIAYLTNTGRAHLTKPVYAGILVAFLISVSTAWHIAELAQEPLMEGILAISAAILVGTLTILVIKGAKNIKANITNTLEKQAQKTGFMAVLGVFLFTVVMIAREGMETAMMIGAISGEFKGGDILVGAILGLGAVAIIGKLWIANSTKINLRLFMQATGLFLILFCLHLFVYGFHELTEANAVPGIDNHYWHVVSEPFEPSEPIGRLISIALIALPIGWIGFGYAKRQRTLSKKPYNVTPSKIETMIEKQPT